jgi:hypothetical protein
MRDTIAPAISIISPTCLPSSSASVGENEALGAGPGKEEAYPSALCAKLFGDPAKGWQPTKIPLIAARRGRREMKDRMVAQEGYV